MPAMPEPNRPTRRTPRWRSTIASVAVVSAFLLALVVGPQAFSQESDDGETPRDPTIPDESFENAANLPATPDAAPRDSASPAQASPQLPELRLRGRILVDGREPIAALEIDGRVVTVRTGDTVDLGGSTRAGNRELVVVAIGADAVRVTLRPDNREWVLR